MLGYLSYSIVRLAICIYLGIPTYPLEAIKKAAKEVRDTADDDDASDDPEDEADTRDFLIGRMIRRSYAAISSVDPDDFHEGQNTLVRLGLLDGVDEDFGSDSDDSVAVRDHQIRRRIERARAGLDSGNPELARLAAADLARLGL